MQLHSHTNWKVNIRVCMGFGRYLRTSRVRLVVPWGRRNIMAPSYVLAIDQGTTSTRAILFDKDGQAWYDLHRQWQHVPVTLLITLIILIRGLSWPQCRAACFPYKFAKRYPRVKQMSATFSQRAASPNAPSKEWGCRYGFPAQRNTSSNVMSGYILRQQNSYLWQRTVPNQQTLCPGEGHRTAGISSETCLSMWRTVTVERRACVVSCTRGVFCRACLDGETLHSTNLWIVAKVHLNAWTVASVAGTILSRDGLSTTQRKYFKVLSLALNRLWIKLELRRMILLALAARSAIGSMTVVQVK